jgi:hypothetical protein
MPIATSITVRDGNNAAQTIPTMDDLAGQKASLVSLDSGRQVYRASANFTPTATGAVTIISLQGSATKTVRVKRVMLGGVSTAVSASVFQILRTTALGAGGTTVNPTIAKLDSASATATAVAAHYTSTLKATGTGASGPLVTRQVGTNVVTTPATAWIEPLAPLFPEAGMPVGQSIVLRGAAEFMEIQNVTPANLGAGTVLSYIIEWEEDAS